METMDNQLEEIYKHICEKYNKLDLYLSKNAMSFYKSGEYKAITQIKNLIESKYIIKEHKQL